MAQPGGPNENAWRMMCICILLNQTAGRQVSAVLADLFAHAGSPAGMAIACHPDRPEYARTMEILTPLGLQNRRASLLRKFSLAWLQHDGHSDISPHSKIDDAVEELALPGVGEYARDAWWIFVRGMIPVSVRDKELSRLLMECMDHAGGSMGDEEMREALSWRADNLIGSDG